MRKLHTQASIAMSESEGQDETMDKMITRGVVSARFKEERNGYRFKIETARNGMEVFADPVRGNEKSRHFMIDDEGDMRVETGKPATAKSPMVKIAILPEGLRIKQPQRMPPEEMENK